MTWILLALAGLIFLTKTEPGQQLSQNLGLDRLLPVGTPIVTPQSPSTTPPATTPPATVPGDPVVLPTLEQAPPPITPPISIAIPSAGPYIVAATPAKSYTGPARSGATTPPFRIPEGMSSNEALAAWVRMITKAKAQAGGAGRNYNIIKAWGVGDPYDLQPDFSLKLRNSPVIIEPDGRLYYQYLLSKGWYISVGILNGAPKTVVATSSKYYGKAVFINEHRERKGDYFTVGLSMGGSLGSGLSWWNIEPTAGFMPLKNSVAEGVYYSPDGFVLKRRKIYIGDKWALLDRAYFAPDGSLMSAEERQSWKEWFLNLPGFLCGDLKGKEAIAYYQSRPWAVDMFRRDVQIKLHGFRGFKDVLFTGLSLKGHDPSLDWLAQQVGSLAGAKKGSNFCYTRLTWPIKQP